MKTHQLLYSTHHEKVLRVWCYSSTRSKPRHYIEVSDQLQAPAALSPGDEPPATHWIGWVGPSGVWMRCRSSVTRTLRLFFLSRALFWVSMHAQIFVLICHVYVQPLRWGDLRFIGFCNM